MTTPKVAVPAPASPRDRARRVLEIEAASVAALVDRIDASFDRAIEVLAATTGKVVVVGLGKSGVICRKIAATLASTGTPATFLHAGESLHGDLGVAARGDTALIVSNSGETREIVAVLPRFGRLEIPVIALTGAPDSALGRAAVATIDVSVAEEACPLALAPTSSTTATLAMGDALALVLMERRGFQPEDFADLHPEGSLGRRLLRVRDLMHVGDAMPIVGAGERLALAIGEMTAKRLGHAGVVDPDGRLVGVLSDGDLRRALERGSSSLDEPVADAMTVDPKTVDASALGAKAVAVMERLSITALFIVDEAGRPIGILHLHDLLKAGVV